MINTSPNQSMKFTFFIIILISFSLNLSFSQSGSVDESKGVLDNPVVFPGWTGDQQDNYTPNEIRFGLFLPEDSSEYNKGLIQAANLAVQEINQDGGYQGLPFRLILRSTPDPWGSGSKDMIRLVYEDSVLAVIGSIDGNSTHIAEQVVTKSWLPLISPVSADPTLTYIRIPWIFRLPPDFKRQSQILISEVSKHILMDKIGLITDIGHDGRQFSEDIKKSMNTYSVSPIFHFEIGNRELDIPSLIERTLSFNPNSIIICLSDDNIIKLIAELEKKTEQVNVLLPWIPGISYAQLQRLYHGNIFVIEPFSISKNPLYMKFESMFKTSYNSKPSFGAAFTYDAIYILTHAIRKSGINRVALRKAISEINDFQGVTGLINWDNGGGNIGKPVLRLLSSEK
jgi:branched-chain amino acid transport system substrate-binding protein